MAVRRKPFFAIVRVFGLFFMGLAIAVFVALSQINLESLRGSVLQILREATDLPMEIDGTVAWKFSLRPRVQLNKVRVLNADWAKNKYALSAERVVVRLNLLSLLRNRPTIQHIDIYDAVVDIEQNANGEYSVEKLYKEDESINADIEHEVKKRQPEYPFKDPGLGGVHVRNLSAHIDNEKYYLEEFSIRYIPKNDNREYSGWIKANTDVFPFIVSYSKYNSERKIYPVQIALATGGDALIANVALEGKSLMPIDFKLRGDIPDVGAFGKIFNLDLQYIPAIKVNIAGGIDRKKLTLRKSSVNVRGTNINFAGSYDWNKNASGINLEIESKYISLMKLFPEMFPKYAWVRPNRDLYVFKDMPLYGQYLYDKDINLRIDITDLMVYRDLNLHDVVLRTKIKNNKIRIDGSLDIADGKMQVFGDADIEPTGELIVQAGTIVHDMSVGKLLEQLRIDNIISDLPVNIEFYGRAHGTNMTELMKTVTGPVQLYSVGQGYAHSELVSYMYGADFLTNLRHSIQDLFRTNKKNNQMKISCVVVNTKLRDGVAEIKHGVAVETNAINLRLAGDVNLGEETMQLALTTVPVRGIKLSLTGNVVNSMEISGNLAEPDIKISGVAVAGKVASATGIGLLLAPFTGGIGLVAGAGVGLLAGDLLENWLADDTPCKTAMQRGGAVRRDDPEWLSTPVAELNQILINQK